MVKIHMEDKAPNEKQYHEKLNYVQKRATKMEKSLETTL